jgi:hypothetical protein
MIFRLSRLSSRDDKQRRDENGEKRRPKDCDNDVNRPWF